MLSGCVATGVVAAAGAILAPISWLFGSDKDDNTIDKIKQRFSEYSNTASKACNHYTQDKIAERKEDEVTSSGENVVENCDKSEFFAVMFVYLQKTNPDMKVEDIKITSSEISNFIPQYAECTVTTGSYTTTVDGNERTITTANVVFSLRGGIMDYLEFTDEDKGQVEAAKVALAEILK
ncbi:hypothetical protein FACS1894133_2440 [Clostridia bacterium]|nr:hypothetical protein FACS1894133_2440 [Clostridia bacterium]